MVSSQLFNFPVFRSIKTLVFRCLFSIGKKSDIGYGVLLKRSHKMKDGKIMIGNYVQLADKCELDYSGGLKIGNGVEITEGVKILTHGHDYLGKRNDDVVPHTNRVYITPLNIGNNVFVGTKAIILHGVNSIGENSIIQAGAVVVKPVPPNVVAAGIPAKIIKEFSPTERYNLISGKFDFE